MAAQETLLNGRYRLISQVASGGMAVVYKAQDLALSRIVAVKILRPSLTGDPQFLTRFRQEARNVANLSHPNIVTLHDVGQDGNTYYMVMEYIEGQDLKKLVRANAPFSIDRMLNIAIQICAGVGYAHRAGLVHADVKPQNALVTSDDRVKVTDFGIAQALQHTQAQERQSVVWGSPHYFAPEQASGETPTPASDVYSIGIVMFEMLTGKLPYNGADQQELALAHIREQVPHVTDHNPSVPVHLDRIIYKVMSKEPANRYRTADQLGRILISYQKQGGEATANVPPSGPSPNQPVVQSAAPPQVQGQQPLRAPYVPQQPQPGQAAQAPTMRPGEYNGGHPVPRTTNVPPYTPLPSTPQQQPLRAPYVPQQTPPPATPYAAPYTPAGSALDRAGAAATNVNAGSYGSYGSSGRPATGPYVPPSTTGPYAPDGSGPRSVPEYQVQTSPSGIDVVSIVLAFIAFLAVLGLLPLWFAVWNTWFPGR
jgi:serine/threonine-protein kinase